MRTLLLLFRTMTVLGVLELIGRNLPFELPHVNHKVTVSVPGYISDNEVLYKGCHKIRVSSVVAFLSPQAGSRLCKSLLQ